MDGSGEVRSFRNERAATQSAPPPALPEDKLFGWSRNNVLRFDLIDFGIQFLLAPLAWRLHSGLPTWWFIGGSILWMVGIWFFVRYFRWRDRPRRERAKSDKNPYILARTDHGSATWAWHDELRANGLFCPDDKRAMLLGYWSDQRTDVAEWCRYPGDGHRLVCGTTGSGKFVSVIAPLLFAGAESSFIVFDVKNGEATNVTGPVRTGVGGAEVLDPFEITTGVQRGALNPLDILYAGDPLLIERANQLADALYLPSMSAGDSYWDEMSKGLLTALLIHVATAPDEPERNLGRVRRIIRQRLPNEVRASMSVNPVADGYVQDQVRALLHAQESGADKIEFYAIDGLEKNTRFLDLPSIQAVTAHSSFDPRVLRDKPSTLYIAVPADKIAIVSRWLRAVYVVLMEAMRDAPTTVPLHVVMDEFRQFGKFTRVAADMAVMRDLGVHFHLFVQSLAQLQALYGEGWQEFMGAATVKQLLGTNDHFTADQFSKLLGMTTVATSGTGHSHTTGGDWQRPTSSTSNSSSMSYAGRPLMTADELLTVRRDVLLTIISGMRPFMMGKTPYVSTPQMRELLGLPPLSAPELAALTARING